VRPYRPLKNVFQLINPHGFGTAQEWKFSGRWFIYKDEYITAGSDEKAPEGFWKKRSIGENLPFWRGLTGKYNEYIKGAMDCDVISYTIDIPYTSHQSFLQKFLDIDRKADTEPILKSTGSNNLNDDVSYLFELDLVKVCLYCSFFISILTLHYLY